MVILCALHEYPSSGIGFEYKYTYFELNLFHHFVTQIFGALVSDQPALLWDIFKSPPATCCGYTDSCVYSHCSYLRE